MSPMLAPARRSSVLFVAWMVLPLVVKESVSADPTAIEGRRLESQARRSLEAIGPVAGYEVRLACRIGHREIEAEIKTAFGVGRYSMRQRHRYKTIGDGRFSEWQGPTFCSVDADQVLTRDSQLSHSAFMQRRDDISQLYASTHSFDPRYLGTCLDGVWRMPEVSPSGDLGRGDWTIEAVEAEERLEGPMLRVDYRSPDRGDVSIWFAPQQGGLVLRMQQKVKSPLGNHEREVVNEIHEWEPEVWFPKATRSRYTINGRTEQEETVEVTGFWVADNRDDAFGLDAIELPMGGVIADLSEKEGSPYYIREQDGLRLMTDDELVRVFSLTSSSKARNPKPLQSDPQAPGNMGVLFWLNLVVVSALIILWSLGRRGERKKT